MNRAECIGKIKKLIPDDNVRNCLFCCDNKDEDEFLTARPIILKYFSNILNIAFVFIYSRYKVWKSIDGVCDGSTPTNFLRVFNELDKIYTGSPLSFDIIENLLVDIQLDIVTNGAICKELRIQNKITKSDNFAKYAYKAKKSRRSSRMQDDVSIEERYEELCDLLSAFPFFRDLSFTKYKIEHAKLLADGEIIDIENLYGITMNYDSPFNREEREFNENIDTNMTLICRNDMYYCLERVDFSQGDDGDCNRMTMNYWLVGSLNENLELVITNEQKAIKNVACDLFLISYDTAYEDYAYRFLSFSEETTETDDKYKISNFYAINYKYIKNLALAISDVILNNGRDNLIEGYGRKHSFEKAETGVYYIYDGRKILYTWSEMISVLMVEEGTTNILTFLIKKDKDIKERLLHNLEFRFGKELLSHEKINRKITADYEKYCDTRSAEEGSHDTILFKSELNEKYSELCARAIVMAISHAVNGNDLKEYQLSFPLSIRAKKTVIDEIKNSSLPLPVKIETVRRIVMQTIKTLYCFYYGFFGYANVKKEFDNESFFKSLSLNEINAFQKKADEAFKAKVRDKIKELSVEPYTSLEGLLSSFRDFCLKCEYNSKENYSQTLKDVLGKNKIIDIYVVDYLLNCFKKDLSEDEFDDVADSIKKIFTYLQTGKSKKNNTSVGVIFPYVSTCEYADISRDGNEMYHFTIISKTGQEVDLRVLSEFTYNLNEKYYFLPNKLSSDERLNLWIEPIIISYSDFGN